jgi:hypothetical protein
MQRNIAIDASLTRLNSQEWITLANRLYREYRTICFWHMKPDLVVTEGHLTIIVDGLRTHGGKPGAREAARLLEFGQARSQSLRRSIVFCHEQEMHADSQFESIRFFPSQRGADFAESLHPTDVTINKVFALAGSKNIRAYIDILQLHRTSFHFGALCWAASGKEPGFTPWLVLELAKRNVKFRPEQLAELQLVEPLDLRQLKQQWLAAVDAAAALFDRLPAEEMGCLYLDESGNAVTPDPAAPNFHQLTRHFGSVYGAWPRLTEKA